MLFTAFIPLSILLKHEKILLVEQSHNLNSMLLTIILIKCRKLILL